MDKIKYYSDKSVVDNYYSMRYGGKSGKFVIRRELSTVKKFLPPKGKVLDVACGLGRVSEILSKDHDITGIDSSPNMLKKCVYEKKILGKATDLPFKETFDIVIILRLLFHYKNIGLFLKEAKKATKKGGIIIFETYRWSPKMFFDIKALGGKIFVYSDKKIVKTLKDLNLRLVGKTSISLFFCI